MHFFKCFLSNQFKHVFLALKKMSCQETVNISLSVSLNICLGAQKNHLIETVLLSTHNICFDQEIRKLIINYALIWRPGVTLLMYAIDTKIIWTGSIIIFTISIDS